MTRVAVRARMRSRYVNAAAYSVFRAGMYANRLKANPRAISPPAIALARRRKWALVEALRKTSMNTPVNPTVMRPTPTWLATDGIRHPIIAG